MVVTFPQSPAWGSSGRRIQDFKAILYVSSSGLAWAVSDWLKKIRTKTMSQAIKAHSSSM